MPVKGVCRARISLLVLTIMLAAIIVTAGADAACAQTASFGEPHPLTLGGVTGWVLTKQAMFYRSLAGMIRAAKNDGSALWALMGVSFVYGIFHAAGPGHGKAVISSYLLANEETWRRGITLSVASSLMQSITAIAIVAIAAVLVEIQESRQMVFFRSCKRVRDELRLVLNRGFGKNPQRLVILV